MNTTTAWALDAFGSDRGPLVQRLAVAALGVGTVIALVSSMSAAPFHDPSATSTRFERVRTAAPSVVTAIDVDAASWLHASQPAPQSPAPRATPLGMLLGAFALPPQIIVGPGTEPEPTDPQPVSVAVEDNTASSAEPACSVIADQEETAVLASGDAHQGSCAPPGPSSAYSDNEGEPDMTKCSAVSEEGDEAASSEGNGTCSTEGMTQDGGGKGSCSAHGADPSRNMDDTGMKHCSTSGGSGEDGEGATTTCSAQQGEDTAGGGCSAGSLQSDDERDSASCSVSSGSEDGSTCSISGDTTNSEMDCSAGNNEAGKSSECSTQSDGGEGSFCSVKAGEGGSTKGSCSAWDMENPKGSGQSGNSACSVLGDGGGKCSVQGSGGGGTHPDGGVDGFCSSGTGGGNQPGSGEAKCSVDPAGDGQGAGSCSAFKPDGTPHPNQPDKDGNCFLPS